MATRYPVIDFHVHPLPIEISADDILKEMSISGVKKAILLAMDLDATILTEKKFLKDIEKSLEYTHIYDVSPIISGMEFLLKKGHTPNSHVANIVREYKDKFIGFGSVQIGHKSKKYINSVLKEIKEYQEELDFRGIKLLPTLQFFDPKNSSGLEQVFKFAEKQDLMIMYHTGCDPGPWEIPLISKMGNPLLIEPMIKKYSSVKIIMAHIGSYSSKHPGIWFNEAIKLIKTYDNLYGDLSAVPFLVSHKKFSAELRSVIDKILYGSDFPITSAGSSMGMKTTIQTILSSEYLTEDEKGKILHLNAEQILE